jgi:hypothetical protein
MTNAHNPKKAIQFDLDDLLHPAQAFDQPRDVVNDADLTLSEKRAILASWASDACAVEAAPALRHAPGGGRPVSVDEILEALQALDKEANHKAIHSPYIRRQLRRRALEIFRNRRRDGAGSGSGFWR